MERKINETHERNGKERNVKNYIREEKYITRS
jgi:hypothetical protein